MFIRFFILYTISLYLGVLFSKMGSGISISKQQAIYIIQRDLTRAFEDAEKNRTKTDNDGHLVYETFDAESNYRNTIRELQRLLRENAVQ